MGNRPLGSAATIFLLPGWKLPLKASEGRPRVPRDTHGDSGGQEERTPQLALGASGTRPSAEP